MVLNVILMVNFAAIQMLLNLFVQQMVKNHLIVELRWVNSLVAKDQSVMKTSIGDAYNRIKPPVQDQIPSLKSAVLIGTTLQKSAAKVQFVVTIIIACLHNWLHQVTYVWSGCMHELTIFMACSFIIVVHNLKLNVCNIICIENKVCSLYFLLELVIFVVKYVNGN